ncbi:carbonic anhydrase [Hamadaea sp. NPDC050747]|uniref:carbonic anhydrase n=1 Tax=Hamadaea sp. NPDC050747 TaxID=3155789 RepID=UPI0033C11753
MSEPEYTDLPVSPADALKLLLDGNDRFVGGDLLHPNQDADRRAVNATGQRPFAVLFGCSDSRLAAEIIFDRGLGDLFVIRTAGHVVGAEVLGSIEYAVAMLDVPLIAVLGHDSCGAIGATLDSIAEGTSPPGFIRDIVERVMISVVPVRELAVRDPDLAVTEHIRYTADTIIERSSLIAERVAEGRCAVVGMSYRLAEGKASLVTRHGV